MTQRERLLASNPILDGVDIDDHGREVLTGLCCVECRREVRARITIAGPWLYGLMCEECNEDLVEWDA